MDVFYITEQEKKRILDARMEQERKANKRRATEFERTHRIAGIGLILLAVASYIVFGMESIIICIVCGLFGIIGLCAREEDRKKWVEQ